MDNREILEIMEKFNQTGLAEMKYKNGETELAFKRYASAPAAAYAPAFAPPSAAPLGYPAPSAQQAAPEAPTVAAGTTINAPIVGTFYRSPAPDAPSFVEEGSEVKVGQVVCIIEAMKNMNQLEAEFDCTIVKALVPNGTLVEYGTPLFEVIKK